jgi:hypothetical protein
MLRLIVAGVMTPSPYPWKASLFPEAKDEKDRNVRENQIMKSKWRKTGRGFCLNVWFFFISLY